MFVIEFNPPVFAIDHPVKRALIQCLEHFVGVIVSATQVHSHRRAAQSLFR
jgi:hypothetical protein